MRDDTTEQPAREIYNINSWSLGYFNIDLDGYVNINLSKSKSKSLIQQQRLIDIVKQARARGLQLPVLIRFLDVLISRLDAIRQAFTKAIVRYEYNNQYQLAYPIKVNQQRSVVHELIHSGVGLEVGSKAELLIAGALACQHKSFIICNGYKDRQYLKLALLYCRLGCNVKIIIEKLSDIYLLNKLLATDTYDYSKYLAFGLRIRLVSIGKGKWQNSGGIKAKFGLLASQVLQAIDILRSANLLGFLKILHFHLGSQVADINDIQTGIAEGARFYTELVKLGVALDTIDIGGGLGIDYEGSQISSDCSVNYSLTEYADIVVRSIQEVCKSAGINEPRIISESGRALVAHHAVLVTDIIDSENLELYAKHHNDQTHQINNNVNNHASNEIRDLLADLQSITANNAVAVYHHASGIFNNIQQQYIHGMVSLFIKAQAEKIYYTISNKVRALLQPRIKSHRQLYDDLNEQLASKLFTNFSLFRSLPDIWALQQIFPIMPINNLNAEFYDRGIIHDLTCDSDGQISNYVDAHGIENTLPLPGNQPNGNITQELLLGFFLVGAYQEILGDIHNLFGNTCSVDIKLSDNNFEIVNLTNGDSIENMITQVGFSADALLKELINNGNFTKDDLIFLQDFMQASTYLS